MDLRLGRTYTGPDGRACTLVAIERRPYDLWRLVVASDGGGRMIFPAADAAKWLKPPVAETSR